MSGVQILYKLTSNKIKYGLERTTALLRACNNPHKKLNLIQVAGTNGKGTAVAMLSNVFIGNNYNTGLFTSPHLVKINERIQINYYPIQDSFINQFIINYKKDIALIKPSFFETITVLALCYFVKNKVDIAILETGLGGGLDSITATRPKTLIFTSIDYDHMHILGNTIEKIAMEKAGAITRDTEVIISCKQKKSVTNILNKYAFSKQKKIIFNTQNNFFYKLNFPGKHQQTNAHLVYSSIKPLKEQFNYKIINTKKHITEAFWPGRIQKIHEAPDVIFDVAHNAQSIDAFIEYFKSIYKQYNITYLIVGFEQTKAIHNSFKLLLQYFKQITLTETKIQKSMAVEDLLQIASIKNQNINIVIEPKTAILKVKKLMRATDCLVILGSHYFGPYINDVFKNCFVLEKKNY